MIRINLLPEEFRRNERTSPKIFAATLAAVILVCSAFGWFGLIYFGDLEKLQTEHAAVTETLTSVNKRVKHHDALVKEKKEFSKRSDTIRSIAKSRMLWTQVVDEFIDMVNNNTERHVSWFSRMEVKNPTSPRLGPTVTLPGAIEGDRISRIADFFDDFRTVPFARDIASLATPSASRDVNTARHPAESYTFTLKWNFKPAKKWVRNVLGAKPGK